jgi:predicted transcriptional regulator
LIRDIGKREDNLEARMPGREYVAKIVSAYAKRNALAADQLPDLIATVHGALARVDAGRTLEPLKGL